MVPTLLFDIVGIDLDRVKYDIAEVESINPHRGAMRLLDGIIHDENNYLKAVAFHDVRKDEFWVEGHIPGRPLFPGVLMIEAAAQLASFMTIKRNPQIKFLGFAGVDKVKFRGQVVPGDRLIILAEALETRPRRHICAAQGLVNGTMVFEAIITGMPM